MTLSATMVMGVVGGTVMYIGARQILATPPTLTIGGLFSFVLYLGFLVAPMLQMVSIGTQLTEALAGLDRTQEVLAERPEDEDTRRVRKIDTIQGYVDFDNVTFEYDAGKTVLRDVSFSSEPGTATALVGPSGSGKSTIISLIAAFHEPTAGRILVDSTDLSTVRLDAFRSQLGVVLAGHVPVRRHDSRKHRLRPPRGHRRGDPRPPAESPASMSLPKSSRRSTTPSSASAASSSPADSASASPSPALFWPIRAS